MKNERKRKWWMRILRGIGQGVEGFAAFLFFYFTISIYGAVIPVGQLQSKGDVCIYVHTNGVHTDVCVPAMSDQMDWTAFIPTVDYDTTTIADYLTVGWGDKGFFLDTPTWAELKVSTALNAAFLPSPTAMHVAYGPEPATGDDHFRVWISKERYTQLIAYIKQSFRMKEGGVELIPNSGYTQFDNFYEAHHSYHLFRTCNIWTNKALKTAGVRTGIYALFPDGIIGHLK